MDLKAVQEMNRQTDRQAERKTDNRQTHREAKVIDRKMEKQIVEQKKKNKD